MSQILKELRGNKDTHNTNSPHRDDADAKSQEEYCRTVRSSVKSGRSKQSSGVGIKLGTNQDRRTTEPERRQGVAAIPKRGRQGHSHTESIAGCYRSYRIDSQSGM